MTSQSPVDTPEVTGQGGFALVAVLAVIAMTALMMGALMGLLILTMRITANHERIERERRAADGAVVATVNHLRLNAGGISACASVPDSLPGFMVPFERVGSSGEVNVTCAAAADDYGEPGGEVKLLGTGYAGSIANWRAAWPWLAAPNGAASAVSAPGVDPTLIHSGPEPLQFNGHVNSIAGAAALRDPLTGSPAIEVNGQYRQGPAGLGGVGSDCGILGVTGSPTFVKAVAGLSCGDSTKLSEAIPADYGIDPDVAPLPAEVSGGCPAGPVVTILSGRYQHNEVKRLNRWFSGACPDRTFHFPTGIYYLDANDPTAPAADRNALIINDSTSNFIFGQAKDWSTSTGATAANFPSACNAGVSATQPGASIVLSGRTSFRHVAGRLAACPFVTPSGEAYPAVLQQDTEPTDVTVLAGAPRDFLPVTNLVSGNSSTPTNNVAMDCAIPLWGNECTSTKYFEVKLDSNSSSSPLHGVQVRIVGDETNFPISVVQRRSVRFDVTLKGGASRICTTGDLDGGVDAGIPATFELLSGDCKDKLTAGAQLDGATVQASVAFKYGGLCFDTFWGACPVSPQRIQIWGVQVVVDSAVSSATSVGPVSSWSNVGNVLDPATGASAVFNLPCGSDVCGWLNQKTLDSSFELDGFHLASPVDSDDALDSIGVVIKQQGFTALTPDKLMTKLPGITQLTLTTSDGAVCTREWPTVISIQGSTYYPMLDKDSSTCGGVSWTPEDQVGSLLDGAKLKVRVRLDCLNPTGDTCQSLVSYVRPVPTSHVALVATTNTYKGPVTKARLTVDSTSSGGGSSANLFGSAYLPHSALDVFWNGQHSGASIFGGELQLWSLGSQMAAGASGDVVCCTKPEVVDNKIRVTAHIDGRAVLSVVVKMATDGSAPEVLEWTQCGRNGECT